MRLRRLRPLLLGAASGFVAFGLSSFGGAGVSHAQTPNSANTLPPVTVDAPQARPRAATRPRAAARGARAARRAARARQQQAAPVTPSAATNAPDTGRRETATSPAQGYVAKRSASGTKTDTPLIETPQSISVVTRDQMDAQAVKSVSQALNYSSGVFAEPRGTVNGYYEFPTIRGFGSTGFLYLDTMQILGASAGAQIEPYGLERIDVIKGPASVLYGQGGPSGIVSMISKRPQPIPFGEVVLQGGSFDRKQAAFDVNQPLDKEGKYLFRLNGLIRDSGTQVDFTKDNRQFIAPSFTWRPTADTSLTILGQYQKSQSGFFNFLPAAGTFLPNRNGVIPSNFFGGDPNFQRSDITLGAVGYLFEHRFSENLAIRQNYRHMELKVDADTLFTGGNSLAADQRTLSRFALLNCDAFSADTVDTQMQFDFRTLAARHQLLVGVDLQHSVESKQTGNGVAPSIDIFNPVYYQTIVTPAVSSSIRTDQKQGGVYVQDQIKLDRLVFLLGGRFDTATTDAASLISTAKQSQNDTAYTKRAGLLYKFDSGVAPYVSYSESFLPTSGTDRLGNLNKPTTGRQYEAGIKYEPTWFKALFTVAVFNLARQNVSTPDPVDPRFSVQTGEITSNGFEAEARVTLTEGLYLVAAYTYLDPKVTKSNGTDLNKVPVGVPANAAALWVDYTFQNGPLGGFGAAGGVRYIDATWGDTLNTVQVPAYTLYDAAIHYDFGYLRPEFKGFKGSINATNLFDTVYVSSCLSTPNQCYYGLRRSVIGTLKYQW